MEQSWQEFLAGKRVTQLGLGLLGRGVNDALFLSRYVDSLTVTDMKNAEQLAESVEELAEVDPARLTLVLGEHRLQDFEGVDFVLKGAGVPLASPEIAHAKLLGVPVYMDESLFEMLKPDGVTTLGVTGTRGKTTTTMLLHHILRHAVEMSAPVEEVAHAKNGKAQTVFLGGNIRGIATLPLLETVEVGDIVVEELSSWQLQGFGDLKRSPHIAIFTNFFEDHLNYYNGSMEAYFADKANIFAHHTEDDVLIMSPQARDAMQNYWNGTHAGLRIVVDEGAYPELLEFLTLPGAHNKQNAVLAIAAAKEMGIEDEHIAQALESFHGAPGRLERVPNTGEVLVFNDATSTTPDALRVALETLAPITNERGGKLVLICGGTGKELPLHAVPELLNTYPQEIIFIPGSGTDALVPLLTDIAVPFSQKENLTEAIAYAKQILTPQDVLVFSPGFASFGEFKNEFDRNDTFLKLIAETF
jgi:UDP-N-acetylmuramoylalanine--D-glutamate ligase